MFFYKDSNGKYHLGQEDLIPAGRNYTMSYTEDKSGVTVYRDDGYAKIAILHGFIVNIVKNGNGDKYANFQEFDDAVSDFFVKASGGEGGDGSASWGNITGSIGSLTDLISRLNPLESTVSSLSVVAVSGSYNDLEDKLVAGTNIVIDPLTNTISSTGGSGAVDSVNGQTGIVLLDKDDIGLSNVDNVKLASESNLNAHTGDSDIHVTVADKNTWNAKQSALTAGSNINITDGTISATDTTYSNATTSQSGLMSGADKLKLDGVEAGAEVNSVTSVASKTGAVTLAKEDVGLSNVDNTSDQDIENSIIGNALDLTSIPGYNPAVSQAIIHNASGSLTWLNL